MGNRRDLVASTEWRQGAVLSASRARARAPSGRAAISTTTAPEVPNDAADGSASKALERFDLSCCIPLLATHFACLFVFETGVSVAAIIACVTTYVLRGLGITVGYHRLLSHRAFETSRPMQFVLAYLGCASAQLGPIWWVAHHRVHHPNADRSGDVHSPLHNGGGWRGFWWAHLGWLVCRRHSEPPRELVADLEQFPEIVWLERFHWIAPLSTIALLFALGEALRAYAPSTGATGAQLVVWGFFISTTAMYHATFAINSVGHTLGTQPFEIADESRNHPVLAFVTLGEGWHNNHHRHPRAARIGIAPGEWDPGHAVLRGLERVGLVWDLKERSSQSASA